HGSPQCDVEARRDSIVERAAELCRHKSRAKKRTGEGCFLGSWGGLWVICTLPPVVAGETYWALGSSAGKGDAEAGASMQTSIYPARVAGQPAAAAECDALEQLQSQMARATRAFLEQQERINGSFASLSEARTAIDAAEVLEQNLQQARRRVLLHREQHHCA